MTTEEAHPGGRPSISDNEIIERFGGIRPMAAKLGVAVTTVQGWKERGHIPAGRFKQIAESAAAHGIDLGGGTAAPMRAEITPATQPAAPREEPATPVKPESSEPQRAEPEPRKGPPPKAAETKPAPAEPAEAKEPALPVRPRGKEAPTRRAGTRVAWLALILAVGLTLALLTRPYWEPVIHRGGVAGIVGADPAGIGRIAVELAKIEETIGELERDVRSRSDTMEGRIGALEAGGGEAGQAFAGQLADLETRMADLARSLDALSSGVSRIEQRLAALESVQDQVSEPVRRELGEIAGRIDLLQSGVEAQEGALKAGLGAIDKVTARLGSRVSELEARPVQTGEKIAALALAIGQLEAALDSGKPYRSALDRLYALGRDDPLITDSETMAVLAPWADYGIPDRLALRRRFVEITPQIDRALAGTQEEGWLDSVWNSVKGLITIRRVDGNGDLSPVSRAEIAMEHGDLTAAAAAFEGTGSLGPEGDAWLNLVRERLAAEREIEALYGRVIAPLAGRAGAGANAQ